MQACGVSLYRLLLPLAVIAIIAVAGDAYEMIVALPDANQTFREIAFNVVASRAESNVKPRVFFDDFPNRVIYARDVVPGGWRDVFMADSSTRIRRPYFSRRRDAWPSTVRSTRGSRAQGRGSSHDRDREARRLRRRCVCVPANHA